MSRLRSFTIRRSHFPFTIPGKVLGRIEAVDRDAALEAARTQFPGVPCTAEPTSENAERLEQALEQLQRRPRRGHPHDRARRP